MAKGNESERFKIFHAKRKRSGEERGREER